MAFTEQIEASLAGQALAQRGVNVAKESIKVHEYTQTREGKMVHVSGYDRNMIRALVEKLKAGHTISFPDGQKVKLSEDGKHLNVVDEKGRTSNFYKNGEHLHGGDTVANHVADNSARSTKPESLGGSTSHRNANHAEEHAILTGPQPKPKTMSDTNLKRAYNAYTRKHHADTVYGGVHGYYKKLMKEMKKRGFDTRRLPSMSQTLSRLA